MNKSQLVDLFRVYEKGLAAKARNKSAENAFVSGLYSYFGKTRPATANNIRAASKKTKNNFERDIRALVILLKANGANAGALANANRQMRQTALNYYYGLENATVAATRSANKLKRVRKPPANAPAAQPPVNIDALFSALVAKAAEVKGARNRSGRQLGPRKYPPGYMENFVLPNGLTMTNFQKKLNSLNTKWPANQNLKRMVEATLMRKYSTFYSAHPNFATGPFKNIMNRATNTKKRLQLGSRRPSITASDAQYQILRTWDPKSKMYYGNMPIWRTLKAADVDKFTNLTNIQKNALKRMIRSVRINNMEPNKLKIRAKGNREELTNNLMKIPSNRNLLEVIKKRIIKKRQEPVFLTNISAGGRKPKPSAKAEPKGAPTSLFTSSMSTNWRNYNH